jgi:hypothetical protein
LNLVLPIQDFSLRQIPTSIPSVVLSDVPPFDVKQATREDDGASQRPV